MNDGIKASAQGGVPVREPRLGSKVMDQLTADVAAFVLPVNNSGRFIVLIDADALGPWTIQGVVNDRLADSFYFLNTGTNSFLLGHEDAGAAAEDRIISPSQLDITLDLDEMAKLWYDEVSTRWRILETTGA